MIGYDKQRTIFQGNKVKTTVEDLIVFPSRRVIILLKSLSQTNRPVKKHQAISNCSSRN